MNEERQNMSNGDMEKAVRIAGLIASFIRGDISARDHDELDGWIEQSDANMKLFEELTDEKNIAGRKAFAAGVDTGAALARVKEKIGKRAKRKTTYLFYAIAACAVGIAVMLFFLFANKATKQSGAVIAVNEIHAGTNRAILRLADSSTISLDTARDGNIRANISKQGNELLYNSRPAAIGYNTLSTPRGGQYRLRLPDGTMVWLNAASSVRYPVRFTGKNRKVEMSGECYFEVAKDPSMPFQVGIGVNTVEVLGTHFDISAYSDDETVAATLLEGAVKIRSSTKEIFMEPGQQAQIGREGNIALMAVNASDAAAWKDGLFVFRSSPIGPIMKQLARWYDADIRYEGHIDYHFNATIERTEDIKKMLKLLEGTGNVHFSVEGKTIIVKP